MRLGELYFVSNRIEEGVALLESALAGARGPGGTRSRSRPSRPSSGGCCSSRAARDEAMPHVERALELGERLRLTERGRQALINKGLLLQRRPNESLGLMRQALVLAEETGDDRGALRACMNLSYLLALSRARMAEAEEVVERGIALARRRGDRIWERGLTTNLVGTYCTSGRWDDVERVVDELPEEGRIS